MDAPARVPADAGTAADASPTFAQCFAAFVRRPSLRMVLVGSGLAAFVSYGMLNWIPAFLMRTQKMPLEAMATWYASAAGLTFGIGILGGGWLVSRFARRSTRAYGTIPALATLILVPTLAAALLVDDWRLSLALMLLPMAACTVYVAPALALVQNLTPPGSRATSVALLLLMFNIVGLGLGPLFVGMVSDALKATYGDESLRWALLSILPFAAAAGSRNMRWPATSKAISPSDPIFRKRSGDDDGRTGRYPGDGPALLRRDRGRRHRDDEGQLRPRCRDLAQQRRGDRHPEQTAATLTGMVARIKDRAYAERQLHVFPGGFVQQHVLKGRRVHDDVAVRLPCAIVCRVEDGKIARLDEYFDSAHVAAFRKYADA